MIFLLDDDVLLVSRKKYISFDNVFLKFIECIKKNSVKTF